MIRTGKDRELLCFNYQKEKRREIEERDRLNRKEESKRDRWERGIEGEI